MTDIKVGRYDLKMWVNPAFGKHFFFAKLSRQRRDMFYLLLLPLEHPNDIPIQIGEKTEPADIGDLGFLLDDFSS